MKAISLGVFALLLGFALGCGKKDKDAGGAAATTGGSTGNTSGSAANDQEALQGEWICTSVEFPKGGEMPGGIAEMFKGMRIVVKGNLITAISPDVKDKDDPGYATFTIDSAKSPKTIDFTGTDSAGKPKPTKKSRIDPKTNKAVATDEPADHTAGIYKLDGDTITVAVTPSSSGHPTDFKPKEPTGKKSDDGLVIVFHLKKKK